MLLLIQALAIEDVEAEVKLGSWLVEDCKARTVLRRLHCEIDRPRDDEPELDLGDEHAQLAEVAWLT